jgi:tetratricopeptide (TPR) repeat protein
MKEQLKSVACSISVSLLLAAVAVEAKEKYCREYSQAKQCFSEKRYKAALPLLDEAIKKNPKEAVYFRDRGHAYYKLDAKEEALADFKTALRLDPDIKLATKSVALCYLSLSKYADAIDTCTKGLEKEPHQYELFAIRGEAYFSIKRFKESIKDMSKAIEMRPIDNYYKARAKAYEELQQWNNAINDYSQSIAINPSTGVQYKRRGLCYMNVREYAKAVSDFSRMIDWQYQPAEAYALRAKAYEKLGRLDLARKDLANTRKTNDDFGVLGP